MSEVAIQARGLHAQLGRKTVLREIDIAFARGKWTSIIGPNGAGKSTLLKALAGLMPHQGEVHFPGLGTQPPGAREKARHLAWLGQNERGADDLTVYDIAMLGRLPHQPWLSSPSEIDRAAVQAALEMAQAWQWRERSLSQLSGGERQRVLLARALAVQADILLMDEPLANLDLPHQVDWLSLVRDLVAQGKTVISILHEISLALHADEIVVVADGRVCHQGTCGAPATHAVIEQVFDNRIHIQRLGDQWICLPRI